MQVKSCKRCGNLFKSDYRIFCPPCQKLEEEEFRKVREYLRANKEAVLLEIVQATGVDRKKILDYIKRGRIEVQKGGFGVPIKCEICGDSVSKGMLCLRCYNKLVKPLKEAPVETEEEIFEPKAEKTPYRRRPGWSFDDEEHVFFRRESSNKKNGDDDEK